MIINNSSNTSPNGTPPGAESILDDDRVIDVNEVINSNNAHVKKGGHSKQKKYVFIIWYLLIINLIVTNFDFIMMNFN